VFEYLRSTKRYKQLSYYSFFYSIIALMVFMGTPRRLGIAIPIFIIFIFLHFVIALLFINNIIIANKESYNVPISTDWIYDIAFIIDFIVILGPVLIFLLFVLMRILGIIN